MVDYKNFVKHNEVQHNSRYKYLFLQNSPQISGHLIPTSWYHVGVWSFTVRNQTDLLPIFIRHL